MWIAADIKLGQHQTFCTVGPLQEFSLFEGNLLNTDDTYHVWALFLGTCILLCVSVVA